MATTDIYTVSGDIINTRHSIRLLGGAVDDGIQVNALAAAIVAANHTMGTITAWVMMPDVAGTYTIFSSGDQDSANEYIHFTVAAGKLQFKIVDTATQLDVVTTSVCLTAHRWYHVAVVQNAERPKIYVNGVEQILTYTTTTAIGAWYAGLDGIDNGLIGGLTSNNIITNEYAGYISDVKIWSGITAASALTAAQIKACYEGTTTTGAIGWYKFDGNSTDYATGAGTYDGTIVGAIIYVDGNEFFSRLSFGCGIPLVGDYPAIAMNERIGIALIIQAA